MFNRIMFIIVLALFILTPVGLVYAEIDTSENFYFDLSNYKVIPNPPKLYRVNNDQSWNTTKDTWSPSKSTACGVFFGVAANNVVNNQSFQTETIVGYRVSSDELYCQLNRKRQYLKNDGSNDGSPTYQYLNYPFAEKVNPSQCVNENISLPVGFYKLGHTTAVPSKICLGNCVLGNDPEYSSANQRTSSQGGWPQPDGTKYTLIAFLANKRTDVSCELNTCSPDDPLCTQPEEPPAEDCSDAEKTANGGKCQTPDPNGNKCPDSQKTGAGGTCSASGDGSGDGEGDGNGSGECTAEQKAANGGTCPAGAGGTCTANPINKKICDFIDAFSKPVPDATDGKVEVKNQTASDVGLTPQQFDTNRVQFGAYCPPASVKSMSFGGESVSIEISYQPLCDFLAFIKYIIIAAASFAAAYILSGVRS